SGQFKNAVIRAEVEALEKAGFYVEMSPSGGGLHAIGLYAGGPITKNKSKPREAYVTERYFRMTGQPVLGIPQRAELSDVTGYFLEWHRKYIGEGSAKKAASVATQLRGPCELVSDDVPLVDELKQGPTFAKLWAGYWDLVVDESQQPGYPSE